MTSARESILLGTLLSVAPFVGCAGRGAAFESVATLPDAGPHPPGVSVDPAGVLPAKTESARTASGVVTLRAPTDPEALRATVRAYFHAIVEESPGELDQVLAPRALFSARSRQVPAKEQLLSRFARYDYGSLRGTVIYRDEELEASEPEPTEGRERAVRSGLDPDAEQRLVRIRIVAPSGGRPRLFGDEVILRLIARGAGWAVLDVNEEF